MNIIDPHNNNDGSNNEHSTLDTREVQKDIATMKALQKEGVSEEDLLKVLCEGSK